MSTSDTIIFYLPIFGTQTNNIQKVKKRPVDCSPNNVTHTQPFNGPFFRDYPVSRYQKCKTNLDFTEAKDSEWQYASLHLAPGRQPCQHPTTQFFYRPYALPAAQPTVSVHLINILTWDLSSSRVEATLGHTLTPSASGMCQLLALAKVSSMSYKCQCHCQCGV